MSQAAGSGEPREGARRRTVKRYQPQTPAPFLAVPGPPPVPWIVWRDYWENFLKLITDEDTTPEEKEGVLLHAIGQEAYRLYKDLPDLDLEEVQLEDDVYSMALKKLEKHFNPAVNVAINRHKFFTRVQQEGESIDSYVSALKRLSLNCNFRGRVDLDEMIRDQIVVHTNNSAIQEKLWMHGDPTLKETLAIARKVELTILCSKSMGKGKDAPESREPQVQKVGPKKKAKPKKKDVKGEDKKPMLCFRCGQEGHFARDKECKGWQNVCSKCKVKGHMPSVCRTGKNRVSMVEEEGSSAEEETEVPRTVCKVSSGVRTAERCPKGVVTIDGCVVVMGIDSGSPYTIVSEEWWRGLPKGAPKLRRKDINPDAYGGSKIEILGYWWAEVEFKGRLASGKIYVAKKGEPILGWTEIKHLGIKLDPSKEDAVLLVSGGAERSWMQGEFPEVFAKKLGKSKHFVHQIKLIEGSTPVVQGVRDIPLKWQKQVREDLEGLLKKGIIEQIDSSLWVSPLVVVLKANGKLRLCVDLTALNKKIWVVRHPLPKIAHMLASIKKAKVFSTIDLASAYHQIPITRSSRPLTAFITPYGLFQFKRMPFGLASAAGVFQKVMETAMEGLEGVCVFQDDILVHGADRSEHDSRLRGVLRRLSDHGFTIEGEKCHFGRDTVDYLGHSLSEKGVGPKERLVNSILDAGAPKDKDDLRSFLGMAEYYSRFIDNFSSLTEPLRKVMKKYVRFTWSRQCQEAFDRVKQEVANIKCLGSFNINEETVLTCDASTKGLGAVLSQGEGVDERVIGFASRALSDAESKYSVIERELLAVSWSMRHFRYFLWGGEFVLKTDHKPLLEVFSVGGLKRATPRILRLLTNTQGFKFRTEYVAGKQNQVADCLSRFPKRRSPEPGPKKGWLGDADLVAQVNWVDRDHREMEKWKEEGELDPEYCEVKRRIVQGWSHKKDLSERMKIYYEVRNSLSIEDGLILRGDQLVPPTSRRKGIVELAHEGHLGNTLTARKVREWYWWPGMDALVKEHVAGCGPCNASDKVIVPMRLPLSPIEVPEAPWRLLGVDILGPYGELDQWPLYFLVIVDHFSKWAEVCELRQVTSQDVIQELEKLFEREGYPQCILSDNGPQFTSRIMTSYCEEKGVEWKFASPYHPQTNGLVERLNRVLVESIQLARASQLKWRIVLKQMLWSYKTTPHVSTGFTPFFIMRGREPVCKFSPAWLSSLRKGPEMDWKQVKDKLIGTKERMVAVHGKKKSCHLVPIECGEWVKIRRKGVVRKGESKYGPPVLVKQVFKNSVMLSDGSVRNKVDVVKSRVQGGEQKEDYSSLARHDVNLPPAERAVTMELAEECDNCAGEGMPRAEEVPRVREIRRVSKMPKRLEDYCVYR